MENSLKRTPPSSELELYRFACRISLRIRKPQGTHFLIQRLYSEGWRENGIPEPSCEEDLDKRHVTFFATQERWGREPEFKVVAWTILEGPLKVPEQIVLPLDVEQDKTHCAILKALV